MASGLSIELVIGVVIGWYISSQFLVGPVSSIAGQVLGSLGSIGGGGGQAAAPAPSGSSQRSATKSGQYSYQQG